MPYCVPITDLKDTNSFSALVNSSAHPIFVTKNGREEFVVMSTSVYDAKTTDPAREAFYASLERSMEDKKAGRVKDAFEFSKELEEEYGL